MEVVMIKLPDELSASIIYNIQAYKRNEMGIIRIPTKSKSDLGIQYLSGYIQESKHIMLKIGGSLSMQQRNIKFLSKCRPFSDFESDLPLLGELEEGKSKVKYDSKQKGDSEHFWRLKNYLVDSDYPNVHEPEDRKRGQSTFDSELEQTLQGIIVPINSIPVI